MFKDIRTELLLGDFGTDRKLRLINQTHIAHMSTKAHVVTSHTLKLIIFLFQQLLSGRKLSIMTGQWVTGTAERPKSPTGPTQVSKLHSNVHRDTSERVTFRFLFCDSHCVLIALKHINFL